MRLTSVLCVACLLGLPGCVLKTPEPVFGETEAEAAAGTGAQSFAVYGRKDGAWVPQDDPLVTFIPEGRHYLLDDHSGADGPDPSERYSFVALDDTSFAVQVIDSDGGAEYGIVTRYGGELLANALDCDDLKADPAALPFVSFDGDDCTLKADAGPPLDAFRAILPGLPGPTLRLVPVP